MLVEKPVAAEPGEAAALVRAAAGAARPVAVVSQMRFDEDLRSIRRQLAAGAIGEPRSARIRMAWRRDPHYYAAGERPRVPR